MHPSPVRTVLLAATWICIGAGGCKRGAPGSTPPLAPVDGRVDEGPAAAANSAPAGMKEPFAPLDAASAKGMAAGFKAFRAAKYSEARGLFHEVVAAHPDYTAARFQELRAAAVADPGADVREQWRDLLMRDFVGYAGSLRTQKDLAQLRGSAQGAELDRIQATARKAYVQGLDKGIFFVARSRPARQPLYDEHGKSVLELNEEAYHFDSTSGLIRRLSDTGGRVAGIWADRARKRLFMLLVDGLVPSETTSGFAFSALSGAATSLDTLDAVGPLPLAIAAPVSEVKICTSEKGEALWVTDVSRTFDAAQKTMVQISETCMPGSGVRVTPYGAVRLRRRPEIAVDRGGVITVSADGGALPIRISNLPRLGSIGWSPGKTRLVYAGELDPCSLEMAGRPRTGMNELYVWDAATRKATRLASGFSSHAWDWLDEDHLVYETGSKKAGKVAVHDFHVQTDTTIDTRAGAGIDAVPTLDCVARTVEEEDEADPEE
jgi:hypothetical protein